MIRLVHLFFFDLFYRQTKSDVNDCPPRFSSSIYNVSVVENSMPESLLKIEATDDDASSVDSLTFRLRDDQNGLFKLDPKSGILTLSKTLDFESQRFYSLIADVFDSEIDPFVDSCTIRIDVLDQNDHAPSIKMKFNSILKQNRERTTAFISEDFDIRLPIGFISVEDRDSADSGKAELTVEPRRFFYLEPIEKNFYALKALNRFDRESISFYQIEIRARDFGQPSLRRSMNFEINVTDVNDERPTFKSNFTFELAENNKVPMVVGRVTASDRDQAENGRISYSIIPASNIFFIDQQDGTISTNFSFDFEREKLFHFRVSGRDQTPPFFESFVDVFVKIINVNEFSPQFEKDFYVFTLEENSTTDGRTFLGQIKASDADDSDRIFYSIANDENIFQIDQNGNLWTENVFDREVKDEFRLTIIATDNFTLSSTSVLVRISDKNDNAPILIWPKDEQIVHRLLDDSPTPQFIGVIAVRDDDLSNNSIAEFSLSENEIFFVDKNGSLWLRNGTTSNGIYSIELKIRNGQFEEKKTIRIRLEEKDRLDRIFMKFFHRSTENVWLIVVFFLTLSGSICSCLTLIYFQCFRSTRERKDVYGSRLIVNDEEKSPKKKLVDDFSTINKQKKNQPSSTVDEIDFSFPSTFHRNSTVSALTTLTRKSRTINKNVSFNPTSTFSTLPKSMNNSKFSQNNVVLPDFDRPKSSTNDEQENNLPKPPPRLNGILLLDKMLNENPTANSSAWYNVSSNFQTRASVV